jgi:serine/threonine protein kinase
MTVQIGDQLGEYRLLRELGSGTFGTVYQAAHVHLGTQVAIKVLNGQITDAERARLRQEARNQAALEYAHIVPVLGYSEQPLPYLVMKFAPNGTLKDYYRLGQRYSLEAILPHVRQIATGLQHAHNLHTLHLDLKPANILLGEHQEALISDFGIAEILQEFKTHKTMSDFAGTPAYAAPEQIQNRPGKASDQYALATMVYQWLTGTLPFRGDPWSIGVQKLAKTPPSPRTYAPDLSPKVEKVLLRALAKEPGKRFPSVGDFARAFEEAAFSATPAARVVSAPLQTPAPQIILPAAPAPQTPAPAAPAHNAIHTATTRISQQVPPTTPAALPPAQTRPTESAATAYIAPGVTIKEPSQADIPTLPSPAGVSSPRPFVSRFRPRLPRGRRKITVMISLAAALLVVLGVAAGYLSTIRIPLQASYTFTTTQAATSIARQQVNSRPLSIEIDHHTLTAPATGGPTPAAQARGTLNFYNNTPKPVFVPQGWVLNDKHAGCTAPIQMVLDADVTIPASPDGQYGQGVEAPAHVLQYGAIGNIPAVPDQGCFHSDEGQAGADGTSFIGWVVQNQTPFTGGRDAIFQQSDIDRAAQSIMAAYQAPDPAESVGLLVRENERLLETPAPSCQPRVTADHAVGEKIGEAQVTLGYVCTGYAYDADGAAQLAISLLTERATHDYTGFFKPDGKITTTITSVTLTDPQKATIRLTVTAQGTWTFHL